LLINRSLLLINRSLSCVSKGQNEYLNSLCCQEVKQKRVVAKGAGSLVHTRSLLTHTRSLLTRKTYSTPYSIERTHLICSGVAMAFLRAGCVSNRLFRVSTGHVHTI
jgi:hypothetical protein